MHHYLKIWNFLQGQTTDSEAPCFKEKDGLSLNKLEDMDLVQRIWEQSDHLSTIRVQDCEQAWVKFMEMNKHIE